jgi:hypothetical protein
MCTTASSPNAWRFLFAIFRSTQPDVFPHPVGADIGCIDIAHRVSRNTGRRRAGSHGTEIARIRYESAQRSVNGTADHDAAQFARLRSRCCVASGRLVAERSADIKRVIRADED